MNARPVPSPLLIVALDYCIYAFYSSHLGIEIGIKEEREREPITPRTILDAVRRGYVQPSRHPFQHIADVAHKRARHGHGIHPAGLRLHLQPARIILFEDRKQAVVGVLTYAPLPFQAGC